MNLGTTTLKIILIEQNEPTKRFLLKKQVCVAILGIKYITICAQAMTMTIFTVFNDTNESFHTEIKISESTHAISGLIFHPGELMFI